MSDQDERSSGPVAETPNGEPAAAPVELSAVDVRPYHHATAGVGAVVSTMKQALPQMGVLRTVSILSKMNQVEGFDCPGCAWPEPGQATARHAEFCENGAKAVAAEATRRRVTADFFREWSVPRLLEQSDYWLEAQGRLTEPMLLPAGADHYEPISWDDAFRLLGAS